MSKKVFCPTSDEVLEETMGFEEPTKDINNENYLLPLYVYQILSSYHTSSQCRLTQQRIIDILSEYPYGIKVNRKALARCINSLEYYVDCGIHTSSTGSWYSAKDDWFVMNRPGKWSNAA